MSAIINGSSPSVTFSDGTTQATSAIVSGYVPYANLPAGSVLQVVQGTYSASTVSTTSTSFVTTNLTVSITPKFATSKILAIATGAFRKGSTNGFGPSLAIYRDSTNVFTSINNDFYNTSGEVSGMATLTYLDSPATTSSTAYSLRFKATQASNGVYFLPDAPSETGSIIVMEIAG